jgi:hypothetical protein
MAIKLTVFDFFELTVTGRVVSSGALSTDLSISLTTKLVLERVCEARVGLSSTTSVAGSPRGWRLKHIIVVLSVGATLHVLEFVTLRSACST